MIDKNLSGRAAFAVATDRPPVEIIRRLYKARQKT